MSASADAKGGQVNNALTIIGQLQQTFDAVTKPLGAAIAADPADLPEWLRPWQSAQRQVCDRFGALGALGPNVPLGRALINACGPYLGADTPFYEPADDTFEGGQCVGRVYLITFRVIPYAGDFAGQEIDNGPFGFTGPISGLRKLAGAGTAGRNLFQLTTGDGVTTFEAFEEMRITTVVPEDGLPDECGNYPDFQPDGYRPTRPEPAPPNDYDYDPGDGGPSITINVGNPTIRVDGSFEVTLNVGGTEANGFGGYPYGTGDDAQPDAPDYETPGTPEAPEEGDNERDSDSPLVAAIVRTTTTDDTRRGDVIGTFGFKYNPAVAQFRFKLQNGSFTEWIPIQHLDQLVVFANGEVEADGYQCAWSYRYNGSVTPIRLISEREDT